MIFSESFGKSVLVIYRLGKSVLVKVSSYYHKQKDSYYCFTKSQNFH